MEGFDTIVVALSRGAGDLSLIGYAGLLAQLGRTRELRFVHVLSRPGEPVAPVREELRERVGGLDVEAHIQCDVLTGPLTDRLLHYGAEVQADMILTGGKRRKLASRLAAVAPCSIAMVPENFAPVLTHIAIALDFSDAATATLEWATSLASAHSNITCTALHVITHESADLFAGEESDGAQAELMRKTVARADRGGVTVNVQLIHPGRCSVAQAILTKAKECDADCIALSTRGRSRSASILLGSVTESVIAEAQIPLLIRKRPGTRIGLPDILLGEVVPGWKHVKTN